ncbi:MAG TPA: hypothetical protein VF054_06445 [Micromonosporaceae bacterium]
MGRIVRGLVSGAAGTLALNAVTYADMAVRGRPASTTPEQSVQRLADATGIDLGDGEKAGNRRAGLAPLLGYATGVGVAVGYALLVPRRLSWPATAGLLGGGAMIAANAPMTVLRITDPRRWTPADWLSDAVPHLAYGVAAALVANRMW